MSTLSISIHIMPSSSETDFNGSLWWVHGWISHSTGQKFQTTDGWKTEINIQTLDLMALNFIFNLKMKKLQWKTINKMDEALEPIVCMVNWFYMKKRDGTNLPPNLWKSHPCVRVCPYSVQGPSHLRHCTCNS